DARPSALTLSRICRTTVLLFPSFRPRMLAVAIVASVLALPITCSAGASLLAMYIPLIFSVAVLLPYQYWLNRCAQGARCCADRVARRFAIRCDGLCEQFGERVDRVDMRRRRVGEAPELHDRTYERVDLRRPPSFDILQHRCLVLAHLLGAGDTLFQSHAKRDAKLMSNRLCLGHHRRRKLTGRRILANIDES